MTEIGDTKGRDFDDDPEGNSDIEDTYLDPRIKKEIDKLNLCGVETNRLENELDEARSKYRSIISETSNRMEAMAHAQKNSIHRAREYYKLKEEAKIAQAEALKAARQFQSANGVYNAAKETVALAECRLIENADAAAAQLTTAWQDMLNHASSKVTMAAQDKSRSEHEHKRRASRFAEIEGRMQTLEHKYKTSIKKARPYFELKADLDLKLIQQKQNVNDLQATIKANKIKYTDALRKLEQISEEIHQARHSQIWSMFPRLPGVGAEKGSTASSIADLDYDPADLLCGSTTEDDADTDSLSLENIDSIMAKDIQNLDNTPSSTCSAMNAENTKICDNTVYATSNDANAQCGQTLDKIPDNNVENCDTTLQSTASPVSNADANKDASSEVPTTESVDNALDSTQGDTEETNAILETCVKQLPEDDVSHRESRELRNGAVSKDECAINKYENTGGDISNVSINTDSEEIQTHVTETTADSTGDMSAIERPALLGSEDEQ